MRKNLTGIKFFAVTARGGHVGGTKFYYPATFGVKSTSASEAAAITRALGRVKHHHKHAIISCREVTRDEYLQIIKANSVNPYFNAENKQQQDLYADEIYSLVCEEEPEPDYRTDDAFSKKSVYAGKNKIRKPKSWGRMMEYDDVD